MLIYFIKERIANGSLFFLAKNLTDNESINRDSFTENFKRSTRYYIMPMRLLFTVKYNL
jgi:hypothetical protein